MNLKSVLDDESLCTVDKEPEFDDVAVALTMDLFDGSSEEEEVTKPARQGGAPNKERETSCRHINK